MSTELEIRELGENTFFDKEVMGQTRRETDLIRPHQLCLNELERRLAGFSQRITQFSQGF